MNSKEKESRKPIKALRTYQGDVDELMSKKGESATTIFIAEEKRREEKPDLLVEMGRNTARNKSFLLLAGVIVSIGIAIVGIVYYTIVQNQAVEVVSEDKALIAFTLKKDIDLMNNSKAEIVSKFKSEIRIFDQQLNSVLFLNVLNGDKKYEIESLLKNIVPNAPGSLLRSFDDDYMFGVLSYDTNELFIILKTSDYALSYSGMLSWEKSMASDLSDLFNISTSYVGLNFTDLELRNKDLRVLKGSDGKTELLYSFIDRNTLVITKNENIFNAILAKYLTNQTR